MKKLLCAGALGAALLLHPATTSAQVVNMTANLVGNEETPAPGVLTGAVGTASLSVDTVAEEISVTMTLYNLPTNTTASHIHVAPKGIAGPVVIDFPIPTARTGDLSVTFRVGASAFRARPEIGINTMTDAIQAITNGNAYVNVHTSGNPGGEVRGQLVAR